ncbi:Phosphoribosyltransferase domain protein [Candidatus Magnetobacterium bavaricum]|uniref:Phosphoribosyltransferase domain protein n=1 Tax=Candidatus Magnetobacterium bavaricum TaxID=29290 RepID=A0A0F3GTN8_9BACT|nr:Phosphoribosyltransferase domain protein [Candidatus Magnetobacterium bavaricum]
MLNSPNTIEGIQLNTGVDIKRNYYENKVEKCPLCKLKQPLFDVTGVEDFYKISPEQLTPFDFWEIVADCKALRTGDCDKQGRRFSFRIETENIFEKYKCWLKNLIEKRFNENWSNMKPNIICTVDEPSGIKFAELVLSAIGVGEIKPIPRAVLNKTTSVGDSSAKKHFKDSDKILIVDDGINYGDTVKAIIGFCKMFEVSPMGVLVFCCRLTEDEISRVKRLMAKKPLVALYKWPSKPTIL